MSSKKSARKTAGSAVVGDGPDSLSGTKPSSTISRSSSNKSTKSKSSIKSSTSQASQDSVGIGSAKLDGGAGGGGAAVGGVNAKAAAANQLVDCKLRFRLMPEGSGNNLVNIYDHHVFDCVVFVIFCERHRSIALTNVSEKHRTYSWFPFVLLHDVFTWSKISRDGLAIILGKMGDSEMDPTMAILPDYTMSWLNILRIQVPKRYHTRITQFVKFNGSTKEFKCCQNTNRIRWVKMSEILKETSQGKKSSVKSSTTSSNVANLWGEEVTIMAHSLCTEERTFLSEFTLNSCYPYGEGSDEANLLKQVSFSVEKVYELYEDYIHHLYPAFFMTLNSFRCFLVKYGLFDKSEIESERTRRLFQMISIVPGSGPTHSRYVTFNRLLMCIASMDPKADSRQLVRIKLIFQYYDKDNRSTLTQSQISQMIKDAEPGQLSSRQLEERVAEGLKHFKVSSTSLSLETFSASMSEHPYPPIGKLLRTEKCYFDAKKSVVNSKSADYLSQGLGGATKNASEPDLKTKSRSNKKGTKEETSTSPSVASVGPLCRHHQPKKYDYGLHAVTLDSAGRCVDPRIICDNWITQWSEKEMSNHRFSIENVFRVNSIGNIFIDLVRDFRNKQLTSGTGPMDAEPPSISNEAKSSISSSADITQAADCRGLLSAEEDWETLTTYLEILCEQSIAIFRNESKILRLSSPIFIFGDLQGSLQDLFVYERQLFHSTPVLATNLLFLGNYSGISFGYGVECVIYLLALKVSMPNKIYLLRGRNELRVFNQKHFAAECAHKYGAKCGDQIYKMLNRVFDVMPIAATVDETVFCTHSGIPRMSSSKSLISYMRTNYGTSAHTELPNPEQSLPIAYELIANLPMTYAPDEVIESSRKSTTGFVVTRFGNAYYYSRAAFDSFMANNEFDFLIRSHNPCEDGYAMCYSNRCLTIYSASKCLDSMLSNTCIIMLNDSKKKIRFVRLSTSKGGNNPNKQPNSAGREKSKKERSC